VGIINFEGYWDPLLKLINHLIEEEFMGNHNLNFFQEIKSTNNLKKFLKNI
jgi:predicted Rossmann-fold nucleotide-binding protein